MELFTFIQMGGERERITVRELVEGARSGLAAFDAAKAKCFLPKDKHKLLSVIEAGFGDLRPFNRVVRAILKERIDEADKEFRPRRPSFTAFVDDAVSNVVGRIRRLSDPRIVVTIESAPRNTREDSYGASEPEMSWQSRAGGTTAMSRGGEGK